jgi:hypothetical protein
MGREAMRYQMTGYLIMAPNWFPPKGQSYTEPPTYGGDRWRHHFTNDQIRMQSNYDAARDLLEDRLMSKSPGRLVDPYNPRLTGMAGYGAAGPLLFMCERYSITETRERGGFCSVEMAFVEGGIPGNMYVTVNTTFNVSQTADDATDAAATELNNEGDDFNSRFVFPAPGTQVLRNNNP